jgi:hypothetical protein
MTLKEIAAMPIKELQRLQLSYAKPWSGYLGHVWYEDRTTLCGKDLLPHMRGEHGYSGSSKHCPICKQRADAIRTRIVKEVLDA